MIRAAVGAAPKVLWTYSGDTGSAHWGALDPSFELCSHGTKQPPIDLPPSAPATAAPARPERAPIPLRVTNTGHTIQVNDSAASSFTVDGVAYTLAQFHFHSPAEHTIARRAFDAEMHLVHKSEDGNLDGSPAPPGHRKP